MSMIQKEACYEQQASLIPPQSLHISHVHRYLSANCPSGTVISNPSTYSKR